MSYLKKHSEPTQKDRLSPDQVKNEAGGYVYEIGLWDKLDRFLILGSEGGTFYVNEQELTRQNIDSIKECIKEDGVRVVNRVLELDTDNRAPKMDPLIYTLALCFTFGSKETKQRVTEVFCKIIRIGTHLFTFVDFINEMRGWGRSLRRLISSWYVHHHFKGSLDYQVVKYQNRKGWSHKDVLRKCHLGATTPFNIATLRWVVGATTDERTITRSNQSEPTIWPATMDSLPELIEGYEQIKKTDKIKDVLKLIETHNFTHEMVPNSWKDRISVWAKLLPQMPLIATIRNLSKMTSINYLTPFSEGTKLVLEKLTEDNIRKSRVHPIQLLIATLAYNRGSGIRGSLTWTPVNTIVDALEAAFYTSFKNVEPTNKNTLLALDISGSMSFGNIAGCPGLTPAKAAAALALVTAKTEKFYQIYGFNYSLTDLNIRSNDTLESALEKTDSWTGGATDCALPMIQATDDKLDIDTFVIYTDNETWAGNIHPKRALDRYRQKLDKPDSKVIVVGMTATDFSIADPKDPKMLDVVGFDAAVPSLISQFSVN